jgi:4-carboxymuconolactone decarboxylase
LRPAISGDAICEEDLNDEKERYQRGLKLFERLYGESGAQTLRTVEQTAPELARYIVEFAFGDVFSRPGLDLKTRELATVAVLAAQGNAPAQIRAHIHGALNAGCTEQEIIEILLQVILYAGFPATINGMLAAREVFAERAANK